MDQYRISITDTLSLVGLLRHRARNQGNYDAYTFLLDGETQEATLTYAAVDAQARAIAAQLQQIASAGDRILLLYPPGLDYITAFFGCLYAHMVAVPAYVPPRNRTDLRLQAIAQDAQPAVVLTTSSVYAEFKRHSVKNPALTTVPWLASDNIELSEAERWQEPALNGDTLAYLQYTSGSTSTPKGVMISHANALHNVRMMQEAGGLPFGSLLFGWVPHYHDLGLVSHIIYPLYTCGRSVLMSPAAFIQKPMRWLQGMSRYQAKGSSAPNFAYDLCVQHSTPEQRATLDLSSLELVLVGGEPVRYDTLINFAAAFAPAGFRERMFFPCYGLAEGTLSVSGSTRERDVIVTYKIDDKALTSNRVMSDSVQHQAANEAASKSLVSCGQPLVDQEIVIVDPDSLSEAKANQIGEIWLKGPNIGGGYWQREDETEKTFHAFLADREAGSFLRTGDLGFMKDGELFVTGRIKDLIIIRGRNHYPQDIELTVEQSHPALQPNAGAAFSVEVDNDERLVIVQEVKRSYRRELNVDEVVEAIRQAVLKEHELQVHAISLLRTMSIPKTSSGKIRRQSCRAQFLEDSFKTLGKWQASQISITEEPVSERQVASAQPSEPISPQAEVIRVWLVNQMAELLKISPQQINVHDPFARYGMDSVNAIALSGRLEEWLGRSLSATLVYDYPSIDALARHLSQESDTVDAKAVAAPRPPQHEMIAVIGMGCRFPGGANNPDSYWQLLRDGKDAITEVPASRWNIDEYYDPDLDSYDKMNTRWGGFVEKVDQFDSSFFGISRGEASGMDPQQRLLLEVAWEALEHAAIDPETLEGSLTGVFIGISSGDYYKAMIGIPPRAGTGIANSIAANRISYILDLCGPSVAIDTACSSSLVSVHMACQSLQTGDSDLALAGGVNLILSPEVTVALSQAGMMASDGHCKSFDAAADGYVRGEGTGIVVLKRLSDALADGDQIFALVRGSAINQDGRSNGLTAPTGPAQQAVIRRALQRANLAPNQIDFIEAHGSGTPLGDVIEIQSLDAVLNIGRSAEQPCALGTAKANIGHLESAAGIAGLIKAVLVLQHGQIPPHPLLKEVNPRLNLHDTPFVIPTIDNPSPIMPHFAGVSSFGFGGTNAHVVLQAAMPVRNTSAKNGPHGHACPLYPLNPPLPIIGEGEKTDLTPPSPITSSLKMIGTPKASKAERGLGGRAGRHAREGRPAVKVFPLSLLTLSAKKEAALKAQASHYAAYLASHPHHSLADICFTANSGRAHFDYRLAISATSHDDMREQLNAFVKGEKSQVLSKRAKGGPPKIAFLFTGQGSQYVGMGQELYESQPVFRQAIEQCDTRLRPHLPQSLLSVLYPASDVTDTKASASPIDNTAYAQPAIFAIEYALAQLWRSWGIEPAAVMGHSIGEYVAACLAGVFTLEDALHLVTLRGRMMSELPSEGGMAVAFAEESLVAEMIAPYAAQLSIAAINGPTQTVISGNQDALDAVAEALDDEFIDTRPLNVSHAFHSPLMEPILQRFEETASQFTFASPTLPLISNLTGQFVSAEEQLDATYWRNHIRHAVRFYQGIQTLAEADYDILLEVGPTDTLINLAKRCLPKGRVIRLASLKRKEANRDTLLKTLANLYVQGAKIDWKRVDDPPQRQRLALPTYPFQRKRCWLGPSEIQYY